MHQRIQQRRDDVTQAIAQLSLRVVADAVTEVRLQLVKLDAVEGGERWSKVAAALSRFEECLEQASPAYNLLTADLHLLTRSFTEILHAIEQQRAANSTGC